MIKRKEEKIRQIEKNLETMNKMLEDNKSKHFLKQLLLEHLNMAKKIAQLQVHSSNTTKDNLNEAYFKIFGKNMIETLDWRNNLYPIINESCDGFVEKLRKKYPDLPEKDVQLCCLLRTDFKTDEITFIQGYNSDNSTQAQKSRIKKKMGFSKLTEFYSFLENI